MESAASSSQRQHLSITRSGLSHKFEIADQDGYIIVGLYDDGRPGEVFLKMGKEGSTLGGLLDCVGILTSVALQHGVPLETLVDKLSYVRFEPSGLTNSPEVGSAHSIVDYVFRWLGAQFLHTEEDDDHAWHFTVRPSALANADFRMRGDAKRRWEQVERRRAYENKELTKH